MSWPRRLAFWSLICGVSAAPSFIWGASLLPGPGPVIGMVLGILAFVAAYTVVTGLPRVQRLRRRRLTNLTMRIGYGTRIGMSVIFPVGLFVDMWTGILAVGLADSVVDPETLGGALMITLIQGTLLNIVLLTYMALCYGLLRLFSNAPDVARPMCLGCGYDIRASVGRCPECGRPIDEIDRAAA